MQVVLNDITPGRQIIVRPEPRMTAEEFWDFCAANPDVDFEMTRNGEIEIVPPAGLDSADSESEVNMLLRLWAKRDGRGRVFSPSAGFILRTGAMRAPDASWIESSRWNALPKDERKRFAPICPDFVIEVRSPGNRMPKLHERMVEYLENGAKLGWLIDPGARVVFIYRPGQQPQRLDAPAQVHGEGPVHGFVLAAKDVWTAK